MDDKKTEDNVTPMFKDGPDVTGMQRINDEPYSTPSRAIALMLKKGGFDTEALNRGVLDIRILAEFNDTGAMFHAIQASVVPPQPSQLSEAIARVPVEAMAPADPPKIDAPAFTVLKMMADDNGLPRMHYINLATVAELDTLDKTLNGASVEDLRTLAAGEEDDQQEVVSRLEAQDAHAILFALFNRG